MKWDALAALAPTEDVAQPTEVPTEAPAPTKSSAFLDQLGADLETPTPQKFNILNELAPELDQATEKANKIVYGDPLIRNFAAGILGSVAGGLRTIPEMAPDWTSAHPELKEKWMIRPAKWAQETSEALVNDMGLAGELAQTIGSSSALGFSTLSQYDEVYQAAIANGATPEQAQVAAIPGFVVNAGLDMLSLGGTFKALKGISGIAAPGLRKAIEFAYHVALSTGLEGTTEAAQEVVKNIVAKNYDPATDGFNLEGATEGAAKAGLLGGLSSLFMSGAGGLAVAPSKDFNVQPHREGTVAETPSDAVKRQDTVSGIQEAMGAVPTNAPLASAVEEAEFSPRKAGKELAQEGHDLAAKVIDAYATPLIQSVEDVGLPSTNTAGDIGRKVIKAHKTWAKKFEPAVVAFQKKIRGTTKEQFETYQELKEFSTPALTGEAWETKFTSAVEDDTDTVLGTLSPGAQEIVKEYRKLSRMEADAAVSLGTNIRIPKRDAQGNIIFQPNSQEPEWAFVPFQGHPKGARVGRSWSSHMWGLLQAGRSDPTYRKLGEILASDPRNNMTEDVALNVLDSLGETVNLNKEAGFEIGRTFPWFPTHILTDSGKTIQLLNSDPFQASQSFLTSKAARLGWIETVGQNSEVGKTLTDAAFNEGGRQAQKKVSNMIQALQHIPLDKPHQFLEIGSRAETAARSLHMIASFFKAGILTLSGVKNLFEGISTIPQVVGTKRYLKGVSGSIFDRNSGVDPITGLHRSLGHTVDVLNFNFDKEYALESIGRLAQNIGQTVSGAKAINEWNEIVASQAALEMAKDLKRGQGTLDDATALKLLRFRADEVTRLMNGSASTALYQDMIQRVTEFAEGTTSVPAERSRLANNRIANFFLAFDSYNKKTTNRTLRIGAEWGEQLRLARTGRADPAKLFSTTKRMGTVLAGAAGAGVASRFTIDLLTYGTAGVSGDLEDLMYDTKSFIWDAIQMTMSGMLGYVYRSLEKEGLQPEQIFFPLKAYKEAHDVLEGKGAYAAYEGIDKYSRYIQRNIPASRAMIHAMAWMGLVSRDPELDVAINKYYKWSRDNLPKDITTTGPPENESDLYERTVAFRRKMKTVEIAVRHGQPMDKILKKLIPAAQAAGTAGVDYRASLLGRRLLTQIPEAYREKFYKEMKPQYLKKIAAYDALLGALAGKR